MDGITGPLLSGTGFYMKREALYGNYKIKGIDHDGLFNFFIREVVCLDQHTNVFKCGSQEIANFSYSAMQQCYRAAISAI
jgi:hypothetical protein